MKERKIRWFTAFKYVVPADYEKWFEDQGREGLHPVRVGQWSSIAMRFEKGDPVNYRYVVDMQPAPKKDYKKTYGEFGWEFVGQMASAYVWRRSYSGERPESFSDAQSKKGRNRRFFWAVMVPLVIFLIGGLGFLGGILFTGLDGSSKIQFGIAAILCLAASLALGMVMKKIRRNIDR